MNDKRERPRFRTIGLVLSGVLALSVGVMASGASLNAGAKVSAHLTKTSFTAEQAQTVKLMYAFSSPSVRFGYVLSMKKGAKWAKLKSVVRQGNFKGSKSMTVKKLFGSRSVTVGRYRVKVSADANSVTRTFAVVQNKPPIPAPGSFGKTSPANGATDQQTGLALSWSGSSNASGYEYCIDTSNDNSCAGGWVSAGASTSASPSGLALGATYYWQVRAKNSSGETLSNGGSWWSFATVPPAPGSFGKTSPANGATDQQTGLALSWSGSSNASGYEYCIDTSNDNTCAGSWVSAGASTSANPTGLVPGTTYYWLVRAKDSSGETYSDGGAWWSFTTWKPTAGTWTTSSGVSFVVGSDQASIDRFAFMFSVSGCGVVTLFAYNSPITNGQFSKTGSYYYNGTFDSSTTAHGTVGLNSYYLAGCGGNATGGPNSWTATWSSS